MCHLHFNHNSQSNFVTARILNTLLKLVWTKVCVTLLDLVSAGLISKVKHLYGVVLVKYWQLIAVVVVWYTSVAHIKWMTWLNRDPTRCSSLYCRLSCMFKARLLPLRYGLGIHRRHRVSWAEPFPSITVYTTSTTNKTSRALLWYKWLYFVIFCLPWY